MPFLWRAARQDRLTFVNFLVGIYQRQSVLLSHAPNPVEIQTWLTEAKQSITQEMLQNVWAEFEFRLNNSVK